MEYLSVERPVSQINDLWSLLFVAGLWGFVGKWNLSWGNLYHFKVMAAGISWTRVAKCNLEKRSVEGVEDVMCDSSSLTISRASSVSRGLDGFSTCQKKTLYFSLSLFTPPPPTPTTF